MTTTTLTFENLPANEATALNAALNAAVNGATVTIALTYNKVTKTKARIANKDYAALPGVESATLIGTVKKVAVGKNGLYILLDATTTRAPIDTLTGEIDGDAIGWTSIKPAGIKRARVLTPVLA